MDKENDITKKRKNVKSVFVEFEKEGDKILGKRRMQAKTAEVFHFDRKIICRWIKRKEKRKLKASKNNIHKPKQIDFVDESGINQFSPSCSMVIPESDDYPVKQRKESWRWTETTRCLHKRVDRGLHRWIVMPSPSEYST
jgi:hypothetical protein